MDGLQARVESPHKMDQKGASLCGPSVFMTLLATLRPQDYVQYVLDLLSKGAAHIGQLDIKPSSSCREFNPYTLPLIKIKDRISKSNFSLAETDYKIHPVDWVALASSERFIQ